jgi:type IV secretory pathway VirB10-like protein
MKTMQPIRKLNQRHIYWGLMGLLGLAMPAVYSITSSSKAERKVSHVRDNPQPNNIAHDAFTIAGTERFPDTYGDVKQFEGELASQKNVHDDVAQALAKLEQEIEHHEAEAAPNSSGSVREYDARQETRRYGHRYGSSSNQDIRQSDIMFLDNKPRNQNNNEDRREPPEEPRTLDPHDMLLVKTDEKDTASIGRKPQVGVIKEPSKFMISEGTLIHAILLSEINTDLPGPILARVSHNIWDSRTGQMLLIPQNSKLIGEYNSSVGHGQSRAQIIWTRIIYPDQQSVDLGSMVGTDKKVTSGAPGIVDNHYDKVVLALLLSTTLNAGVRMTQGKYDKNSSSIGEDIGNSLAQETSRFGSRVADKMLSIKPTITVPIGERLNVFVEKDLHLKPYSG